MNSILKIKNGSKFWVIPNTENDDLSFLNYGIIHREKGPAIEWKDGGKEWYINGLLHREDGPAIEFRNDNIVWCLNNESIKKPKMKMMEKYIRLNPDNILKKWEYPLKIQLLAISLKQDVIFNIPYPHKKLKEYYPKQMALRDIGLI